MSSARLQLIAVPERCYRCNRTTRGIVGVLLLSSDGDDLAFHEFDDIAGRLATALDPADLARLGIGPIKIRRSRQRGAYLSNGCAHCDAILGSFPLREALSEYLAEGGRITDLAVSIQPQVAVRSGQA